MRPATGTEVEPGCGVQRGHKRIIGSFLFSIFSPVQSYELAEAEEEIMEMILTMDNNSKSFHDQGAPGERRIHLDSLRRMTFTGRFLRID